MFGTWRLRVAGIAMLVGFSLLALARAEQGFGPYNEKMIDIDGSKRPETIPDWQAWSVTFRVLDSSAGSRGSDRRPDLHLSRKEADLVFEAAREAVRTDARCQRAISDRLAELMPEHNQRLILGCRQLQLDIADKLVASLPAASRPALLAFVNERRRGISARVPENGLAFYWSPR